MKKGKAKEKIDERIIKSLLSGHPKKYSAILQEWGVADKQNSQYLKVLNKLKKEKIITCNKEIPKHEREIYSKKVGKFMKIEIKDFIYKLNFNKIFVDYICKRFKFDFTAKDKLILQNFLKCPVYIQKILPEILARIDIKEKLIFILFKYSTDLSYLSPFPRKDNPYNLDIIAHKKWEERSIKNEKRLFRLEGSYSKIRELREFKELCERKLNIFERFYWQKKAM
ncbi:MAG: hypothetical protein AABX72_03380 [Nanoarchaeota archaeon]